MIETGPGQFAEQAVPADNPAPENDAAPPPLAEPPTSDASEADGAEPPPEDNTYLSLLQAMDADPDTATLREVARTAVPLPDSIVAACDEWQAIKARLAGQGALFPNPILFRLYELRAALLEDLALWSLPTKSPADGAARLRLLTQRLAADEPGIESDRMLHLLDSLSADLDRLDSGSAERREKASQVGTGPALQTATERRAAVIGHLCDPELSRWSDRAIARACGVSPQTVGNWRRKLSDDTGQSEPDGTVRLFVRDGRTHAMETRSIGNHPE